VRQAKWWVGAGIAVMLATLAPALPVMPALGAITQFGYPQARAQDVDIEEEKLRRLQLTLKKLRVTLQSMKEIEALTQQGLPAEQAKEIRAAAEAKVRQLISDVLFILRTM